MQFIGIAALDSEAAMQSFVAATGVKDVFPNVNDENGDIWARYGIGYQPAFVFLGANGVQETFGSLGEQDITDRISSLFGSR